MNRSASLVSAFEDFGGMKIAKQWIDATVSFNQTTLLHLLLTVLKELPIQLSSITEARINEPIVALRKTATNELVKRAAQDLLKHWRSRFTEKPKENVSPQAKEPAPTATLPAATAPSTVGRVLSKSNDVLGNMLRKQTSNSKKSKKKDSTLMKIVAAQQKEDRETSSFTAASTSSSSSSLSVVVSLPTIERFDQAKEKDTTPAAPSGRKIRWADDVGKELANIREIPSWRDMIMHSESYDDKNNNMANSNINSSSSPSLSEAAVSSRGRGRSFHEAMLREHANEKHALQKYYEYISFTIALLVIYIYIYTLTISF